MKQIIRLLAAMMLMIVIFSIAALADNTAPFSLREEDNNQVSTKENGRISAFPSDRGYRNLTATKNWIYQTRINGVMINLGLYEPNGNGIMFQENLCRATDGNVCLEMRQRNSKGGVLLQMDEKALDVLKRIGVSEIVVVDENYYIQNRYTVDTLQSIRSMLGLRAQDMLSVSGLADPVSVVDENGVRRIISE